MKDPRYIIVIGASAGGLNSVIELLAHFNQEMDAAICIVMHTPTIAFPQLVVDRMQKNSVFTIKMAEHGETILSQHVYMAVPDHHLILKKGKILLGRGPVENRWRPSIDVLFRSAAVHYDSRAIGVILTGMLEDGTAGMQTIKQCGGTCIVQDPKQAEYPDMPMSILRLMKVDYCTTLQRIAIILQEKTKNSVPVKAAVPAEIKREAEIAERVAIGIDNMQPIGGELSAYSCPDCGGALWEINQQGVIRYRCHTGHMYMTDELQERKRQELENAFWVAIRIMEERRSLLIRMSEEEKSKGWERSSENKVKRAVELEGHINKLKEVLFTSTDDPDPTPLQLKGV